MAKHLKMGEMANQTACDIGTIRFYGREGLLPTTARSENNYRPYADETHVERLTFTRHCRAPDMTLDDVRVLLRFVMHQTGNVAMLEAQRRDFCADAGSPFPVALRTDAGRIQALKVLDEVVVKSGRLGEHQANAAHSFHPDCRCIGCRASAFGKSRQTVPPYNASVSTSDESMPSRQDAS